MNISCASAAQIETYRSAIYKCATIFNCFVAIISFVMMFFAAKKLVTQSIIQSSTRIFLLFSLFFGSWHQSAYFVMKIITLHQMFFKLDQPCELFFVVSECISINRFIIGGNCGLVLIESSMCIDRILSTILPNKYQKISYFTGALMSLVVTFVSLTMIDILTNGDALDDIVPNCGYVPPKSAKTIDRFLTICFYLCIVQIIIDIVILKYSLMKNKTEKKLFNMTERYRVREHLKCTQAIVGISLVQFVFQLFYSSFTLFLFDLQMNGRITPFEYGMAISLTYAPPYTCIFHPLLIILTLRYITYRRKKSIRDMTNRKDTQAEYMNRINDMWK